MEIKKNCIRNGIKICSAWRCLKPAGKHKRFCSKHHHKYQKEHNLIGYTFSQLKSNAKRRGKEFTLILEEFKDFCKQTNYIKRKGKHKNSLTIDRVDAYRGYSIDNIRVCSKN